MNRFKSGLWLAVLAVLALVGCQQKSTAVVTVATDATWPPFEYVQESDKQIVGFDIDLLRAIAEAGGFEVQFVNVGFDSLLAGVAQGEYDAAISSITITDERKQKMLFSEPYYNAGQVVVVRLEETGIQGPADLTGHTAGAQIGTTGAMEIQVISGATLKTYDTIDLAFLDLLNKNLDAVVVDNPLALGYVGKYADQLQIVGDPFTAEWYGIAVKPGGEELLAKINQGLAQVKTQNLIPTLETRWLSSSTPAGQ